MNVALSATIQQNSHSMFNDWNHSIRNGLSLDSNPSMANLTSNECRQSEELSNHMMNCLRYEVHSRRD